MGGKRLSERTMAHAKPETLIDYCMADMQRRDRTDDSVGTNRRALRRFGGLSIPNPLVSRTWRSQSRLWTATSRPCSKGTGRWERLQKELTNLDVALPFTNRPHSPLRRINASVEEWLVVLDVSPKDSACRADWPEKGCGIRFTRPPAHTLTRKC